MADGGIVCTPVSTSEVAPPGDADPAVVTLVEDADGHERTVQGVQVRSFRLGKGQGPNVTTTQAGTGFVATSVRAGFPMAARAVTAPDRVYAVMAFAAPAGSRWCDRDLATDQMLFYGPEARHTAVHPVGVHWAFAAMDRNALSQTAEGMGLTPYLPGPGEIRAVPTGGSHPLRHVLASIADPASGLVHDQGPELLRTAIETLRTDGKVASCRRIDSGALVLACLDYAERAQRVPSIDELCAATFVCRRKLWDVFDERFGMAPARFFRAWGLAQARARLQTADPTTTTVLEVAHDLGFHHAGRFASRYRHTFGESPSQALQSSG